MTGTGGRSDELIGILKDFELRSVKMMHENLTPPLACQSVLLPSFRVRRLCGAQRVLAVPLRSVVCLRGLLSHPCLVAEHRFQECHAVPWELAARCSGVSPLAPGPSPRGPQQLCEGQRPTSTDEGEMVAEQAPAPPSRTGTALPLHGQQRFSGGGPYAPRTALIGSQCCQ